MSTTDSSDPSERESPNDLCYILMHHRTTALTPGKLRGNATTVYSDLRTAVNRVKAIRARHPTSQQVGSSSLQFADDARVYQHEPAAKPFELLKYSERGGEGRMWSHYWWIETVECVGMNTKVRESKERCMCESKRGDGTREREMVVMRVHEQEGGTQDEEKRREAEFLKRLG